MNKGVREILRYSREMGNDPAMVIGGGGNSSVKTRDKMWVKASGYAMGDMPPEALLCLDLEKVLGLMTAPAPAGNREAVDAHIAQQLLNARINPPRPDIRPSVEAMLHASMPFKFVMHTHPTLTGALTASKAGKAMAARMAIPPHLWIEYIDPGLPLAKKIVRLLNQYGDNPPQIIFLAKHGFLVAADTIDELKKLTRTVLREIRKALSKPASKKAVAAFPGPCKVPPLKEALWGEALSVLSPTLRGALQDPRQLVLPCRDKALVRLLGGRDIRKYLTAGPLSPDQVVYCKTHPLFHNVNWRAAPDGWHEGLKRAVMDYQARHGCDPQVVLIPGFGAFYVGGSVDYINIARAMYMQALDITRMTVAFDGIRPMTAKEYNYIANWSMEKYRRALVEKSAGATPAAGKVAVVTGSAQGVGLEIAQGLAAAGASVVLCDVNGKGARQAAEGIRQQYGPSSAMGMAADVTSEKAMRQVMTDTLKHFGGLDLMVANAGILKSHKITEFPVDTFRRILDINLTGVFICAKTAASVMRYAGRGDIIQLNSKSGKKGSKHNAAYAASKFAGVGLVQSIALDLVEDGIKVNAICPGNFFDLPLWSSPGGLFDQYRGKFGGVSREAVRGIYEKQIPMGRGCRVSDVVKAILYIMDQAYETGQAYNVTGGQEMR